MLKLDLPEEWRRQVQMRESSANSENMGAGYRQFGAAVVPILRRLISHGLDRCFLPGSSLQDLMFSTRDTMGLIEEQDVRITVALDLDGKVISVLSNCVPGTLTWASSTMLDWEQQGKEDPALMKMVRDQVRWYGILLRDQLMSNAIPLVGPNIPPDVVTPLPLVCHNNGKSWSPRVEILEHRHVDLAIEVLLGQFADLWRLSRPGLPLPLVLVGRGSIE